MSVVLSAPRAVALCWLFLNWSHYLQIPPSGAFPGSVSAEGQAEGALLRLRAVKLFNHSCYPHLWCVPYCLSYLGTGNREGKVSKSQGSGLLFLS